MGKFRLKIVFISKILQTRATYSIIQLYFCPAEERAFSPSSHLRRAESCKAHHIADDVSLRH